MSDILEMPADVAKGIIAVMRGVEKLKKDSRNEHGKYNYVSVDQFYDLTGKLMADAGIVISLDETLSEVNVRDTRNGPSAWLTCNYDIYVYAETGACYGPVKRSIQVAASGPQSYASACSFVEKYYMRSLFKIPTGEDIEADNHEKAELPTKPAPKKAPPPKPDVPLMSEGESESALEDIVELIANATTREELKQLLEEMGKALPRMLPVHREEVKTKFREAEDRIMAEREGKAA